MLISKGADINRINEVSDTTCTVEDKIKFTFRLVRRLCNGDKTPTCRWSPSFLCSSPLDRFAVVFVHVQ